MQGSRDIGTAGVVAALLLAGVTDFLGRMAQAGLMAAWLLVAATIMWRRTPLRAVPTLFAGLAVLLVWGTTETPILSEFVAADPWRLAWVVPAVVLGLGMVVSIAHKADARRHPRAHERFLAAMRDASVLDRLTWRFVPTIAADRFADPRGQ
jgi:hypothetical protein